jgi:hypothetical protein
VPLALIGMVGTVVLLRPAEQGSPTQASDKTDHPEQKKPKTKPPDDSATGKSEESKANVYAPDCENPKEHPEADLCAQRRMAEAAVWQNWINSLGLGGLIATFLATSLAALAAWQTVWTMQDTAKRQLRAYVFGKPIGLKLTGNTVTTLTFQIRNHGQTPANNVAIRGAINVYPYPLPPNFNLWDVGIGGASTQSLGPLADLTAPHHVGRAPSDTDAANLRAGTHRVYAFAIIRYRDIFLKDCTTKICASLDGRVFMAAVDQSLAGGSGSLRADWDFDPQHNEND